MIQAPAPGESYGTHVGKWYANDTELYTLYTLLGIVVGSIDFGSFTGATLSDDKDAKTLFQELETMLETAYTILGLAVGATHFGTFSGSTLSDNEDAKTLFQELETAVEAIYTPIGIAIGASDFGTFTGSTLSDNEDAKTLLQQLETAIEAATILNPYDSVMTGNETFTMPTTAERKYFLDPNGAHRNFDPSGVFLAGFQATVINVGGSYNIVFDSGVSAQTLTPGSVGTFIYDGSKWW